ncbi:protein of unknown function DUF1549 [Pirellula staleyi DSM 6068]|uniref:Cytochrome c domain-containing protein n=1 Tax=Pirellula staleyi (strain ATCC 27377 / DSM 6068 / ICPB 4128) TaxID=530564 RepID=D2QYJ5_PIRSD|nr:PSD1 and planctomycete cytochrome C domain-containing protein [Pirellula staleyi]ADB18154.1 protein of unknown function DUF1549 [Pirellula staleyi DSM 6068]
MMLTPPIRGNVLPHGVVAMLLVMLGTSAAGAADPDPTSVEFFEKKIRPVLVEHCYECHSAEAEAKSKLKGGLKLDSRAAMMQGGDSGSAVVIGKPEEGQLVSSIRYDGDYQMPPKGKLPDHVVADFETWVRSGAVDPREGSPDASAKPAFDWSAARSHWSFRPPTMPAIPEVKQADWPQSEVDRFILAKMEAQGLTTVEAADNRTLLRRLYFDLIGLPPTLEEIRAFDAAATVDRAKALEAVVDRLLAMPQYGERWARHWLDVARFAHDQAHTFGVRPKDNAFQYRDWVIEALNNDMPYDQFVRLQIAGDLLPAAQPLRGDVYATSAKAPDPQQFVQLAGLGFLGLGAEYYKNSDKARAEADELDDRIDTLTRGFLGLTVACARCHDHKFDPIPTHDYYALAGIFSGSSLGEAPLVADGIVQAFAEGQKRIKQQEELIKEWMLELQHKRGREEASLATKYITTAWHASQLQEAKVKFSVEQLAEREMLNSYFLDRWVKYFTSGNPDRIADLLKPLREVKIPAEGLTSESPVAVPDAVRAIVEKFQPEFDAALADYDQATRDYEQELASAADDAKAKVKRRQLEKPREQLLKAIWLDDQSPLWVSPGELEKQFLSDEHKTELTSKREELEARKKAAPEPYPAAPVIKGGGKTLQIFVRGNPAVRGDWAARGFLQIVTGQEPTKDPQQAQSINYTRLELAEAVASPENPLTARVIVNRVWQQHFGRGIVETASNFGHSGELPSHPELLDYLAIRFIENGWSLKWLHKQLILSATYQASSKSHEKNAQIDGGNRYFWHAERRRLDVEAWRDSLLQVAGTLDRTLGGPAFDLGDTGSKRRTIYAKISRHELDGLLRLFDFPDANVTADRRNVTTVPQQQLFVLNSDFMIAQAKALATLLAKEPDIAAQVTAAYAAAFGRAPTDNERELGTAFLSAKQAAEDKLSPLEQYAQAILASSEMMYVD